MAQDFSQRNRRGEGGEFQVHIESISGYGIDQDKRDVLPSQGSESSSPATSCSNRTTEVNHGKAELGAIPDDKPVKVTVELPAPLHRDLVAYAEVLARETGQPGDDPMKLIVPMLEHFITTDRGFAKARRSAASLERGS